MWPQGELNANKKSKDKQCTIIADLLVEGKTGVDLENAVKKWENQNKVEVGGGQSEGDLGKGEHKTEDTVKDACMHVRSQMPDAINTWFKIPLMAMFKWSLSAPVSQCLPENLQQHLPPSHAQTCQASLGSAFANVSYNMYNTPAHPHGHPIVIEPLFANYNTPGLNNMDCFRPWSYAPVKHWAEACQPYTQMLIFIIEFGGPDMYGWGDCVGDVCSANGKVAMYGGTNMPEPCSPVDYMHTHPDELYGGTVAELNLVHVCPGYGPAMVKY